MQEEIMIALDCPYCGESIYEVVSWFQKTYSTCPCCDKGLAAGQFTSAIAALEQAMEESVEELIHGPSHSGCCGKKSSCCGESGSRES